MKSTILLLVYICLQESTTPCDKSLLVDYTTYHTSFNMTTESDEGTIYPSALQALKNSEDNGWRTMAREDQLFIMSFTLPDICSKNWEISTINFKAQYAKEVQLKVDTTEIYKWVRKLCIISWVLVIVIVYSEFLRSFAFRTRETGKRRSGRSGKKNIKSTGFNNI